MNIKEKKEKIEFEVTLKNDYLFKRLLGAEENKAILQNFLECVLNIPHKEIEEIELLDKELKKDLIDEKTGILDVKIRFKNKTIINIEIQNLWDESFVNRTLFYWAKIYIEEFRRGEDYSELRKCITINIVAKGFDLNDKIHSKYLLKEEESSEKLTDIMELHFLNLEKAREEKDIDDPLVRWLLFIDSNSKEERCMLAENSPVLKILNEKVNILNLNPAEKKLYESRMMLKSDIVSISNSQFRKGKEEGIKEGIKEGTLTLAKTFRNMGFPIEKIAQATGLSKNEIEKL